MAVSENQGVSIMKIEIITKDYSAPMKPLDNISKLRCAMEGMNENDTR